MARAMGWVTDEFGDACWSERWNIVAICTGVADSFSATVDLYQNTKVEGSPSLIIEDPRLG
jgi:hypothetical protein